MKKRKKRPVPPPPPAVMDEEMIKRMQDEDEPDMPQMQTPMYDMDDSEYQKRHVLAGVLQHQSALEGFVLLKNNGILPFPENIKLNVFGRHAGLFFSEDVCNKYGVKLNKELFDFYADYKTQDPGYTGSGYDEVKGKYVPQNRTSTGMFGKVGYLEHEPFIGYDVCNKDGSIRIRQIPTDLLERAKGFSDTAIVVLYRHGGEGADHEKGDERLSEGETAMLSFCSCNFRNVVVILACNSVIDGDFLVRNMAHKFYLYTYGGGVYSNNIGKEILPDFKRRVELKYPEPHIYPVDAERLGGVLYTCNKPGSHGAEALMDLLLGRENPSGRLMDEIVYDYDDNPVSRCSGGLVFSREGTTEDLYIYGHNYVAYKEGIYLGYKYFETFCPERVVYPFGYGLSYSHFLWSVGELNTGMNEFGEIQFSAEVTVKNLGIYPGKDVIQVYVTAPYYEKGKYHIEKPLVSLCAFEKTGQILPGNEETVSLCWNARDIACYSDIAECYVLEKGNYLFQVAANAQVAHTDPESVLDWFCPEDILFTHDEVTGTPYRNLFTGNDQEGWRFDAGGTKKENIVYLHRIDVDGKPTVAPGTYPENQVVNEITRETTQTLDLETRKLENYYEMDGTYIHLYDSDIPVPVTNAVYRKGDGEQNNFMLQDVWRYLRDKHSLFFHNLTALKCHTGIDTEVWDDDLVWDYYIQQFSVNEMLCRFYHSGFEIPALLEYGIPVAYSADTPGQIGTNNKLPMGRTTEYCDTILACTFNKKLCYELGLALAREAAASGEAGTSFFYAPGNNLHRSCLSGKNNNYFSEDSHLAGWICGYFTKGLQEGGVNCCMKHFACNDQEISREGLVVFANEQTLRENYFAAFEHALKIGGGKGIMTSLGRVGTVNACGNNHLTVELLRKEWGFDGMVITDGYGVTSYMYEINDMMGANSGLLCFNNAGNFGECRDFMELYRYYLQYPGRVTKALQQFMKGSLNALMDSHTFRDLYTNYTHNSGTTTDINWYDGQIGVGYDYFQADSITYLGVKLKNGESNPPSMMPNTNCKDRSGTIRLDDYGLQKLNISVHPGQHFSVSVSMEKCVGMQSMGFSICYDTAFFSVVDIDFSCSILSGYRHALHHRRYGVDVVLYTDGTLFQNPCGRLFSLVLKVSSEATIGTYSISLLPQLDSDENPTDSFLDKQGNAMSISLVSQRDKYHMSGGWSGTYQDVENSSWQRKMYATPEELAELTLLSNSIEVC